MRSRIRYVVVPLAVAVAATLAGVTASAAADHTSLPALVPTTATPNINDGANNVVYAITHIGTRVIAAGIFQSARNQGSSTDIPRTNILAFNAATGQVDTGFVPTLDGEVDALLPGPSADTVYVGGKFNTVNGTTHRKLVMLNTVTGAVVPTFQPGALDGLVNAIGSAGGRLYIGGTFTKVGTVAHGGLATLNPTTGATDEFLAVTLAGHHNYNGVSGAKSGIGADKLTLSSDGTKLMVIGNFKTVDGQAHDQGVMIDISGASAAILPWAAPELTVSCNRNAFDEWVRDVAFSPDGTYFIIVGTGGPSTGTLCDSVSRWETADMNNTAAHSTWVDRTGGDTVLATAVTSTAVYVGGHFRWLNNSNGRDSSGAGAVGRASVAALDPKSGLPLAWNPGRDPRGGGIRALYVDSTGLYIGSDTNFIGYAQYYRGKIAFLPLAGGYTPAGTAVQQLPGKVYVPGIVATVPSVLYRVNAGGPTVPAIDGGLDWAADDGATSPYHNTGGGMLVHNVKVISKQDAALPASTPLDLFSTWRVDPASTPDLIWTFPVTAGTAVKVRLYFADRNFPAYVAGQRQFDITINGTVVDPDYDIVGTSAYNTATLREYSVTSTGTITIQLAAVADKPLIDAVEIVRDGGATSGVGVGARTYDGTSAGTLAAIGGADGTPWDSERGAFLVDGQLFYGMSDGNLYKRSFDGSNFGPVLVVNPFSDPFWDTKTTGSGTSVYKGVKSGFYAEIPGITAMFYQNGKLYYTRSGQSSLYWRWFSPDSGVTGADEFTIAGNSFTGSGGALFISGDNLYWSKTDNKLYRVAWTGSGFTGTATAVSGPGIDSATWASSGSWLGP